MDTRQQYIDNWKLRGPIWTLGHFIYEFKFLRKLFSKIVNLFKPDFVIVGNNKMYIDKNDRVVSAKLLLDGVWEEYETELFKKNLKKGDVVIDIGANIGYHTLIAAELVGSRGHVYAFEPDPHNFQFLEKNVNANKYKNVTLINKALSNKKGRSKLFLSNEDNYGDFRIYDSQDKRPSIDIELITLDQYFSKNKKIDVIKIDVQGAEGLVLKGGTSLLKRTKKLTLFTEFWPMALEMSGVTGTEYLDILKKNRFDIYEINSSQKKVKRVVAKDLFRRFPKDSKYNADLLCIKN